MVIFDRVYSDPLLVGRVAPPGNCLNAMGVGDGDLQPRVQRSASGGSVLQPPGNCGM